ncbi:MAG: type II toxin-antitoxin system VapC family toxin [Actinobacteria bacterium]|nr:type II toxin-antitoxin system VapC family toxin [Actinomycetota bacterium]
MIVYFETSALFKLFVQEPGSDVAAALWDGADAVVTGRITYPEARAALASGERMRRLTPTLHRRAKHQLEQLWDEMRVVELDASVSRTASELAERYGLRGYDAVHLAAVLVIREDAPLLATWDAELATAANLADIAVAPG